MTKLQSKLIKMFICVIFAGVLSGCYDDNPEFVMQRVDYKGNELALNGYYYHQSNNAGKQTHVYFLFGNGLILNPYSYSTHDMNEVEQMLVIGYERFKKYNNRWGVFVVNGNRLEYEQYDSEKGGVFRCVGSINNDTTIRLLQKIDDYFGVTPEDKLLRFKKFSPKPDSIKSFIK